jgi:hypothetical protein
MKRLKKGPEINLSKLRSGDLKPPKAIGDLYRELKGQHLLPIVALLVIGLIAIPVLVGGSSDHPKSPGVANPAATGSSSTKQTAVEVRRWTPGLLDYKKSLRGARPSDPFRPKVTSSVEGSESSSNEVEPAPAPSEIEPAGATEEASASESPPSTPAPTPSSPGEGKKEGSKGHGEGPEEHESGAVTIDIQVATVHEQGGVDRNPVRRDLPQLTKLPNETTSALTYIGPSEDGTKAMMTVSPEVTAMVGDSNCVVHANPCGLLALQVGAPETIVFGPQGLTYRIELVRIGNHSISAGDSKANRRDSKSGQGAGNAPQPRESDALIGVGSRRIVERRPGA